MGYSGPVATFVLRDNVDNPAECALIDHADPSLAPKARSMPAYGHAIGTLAIENKG